MYCAGKRKSWPPCWNLLEWYDCTSKVFWVSMIFHFQWVFRKGFFNTFRENFLSSNTIKMMKIEQSHITSRNQWLLGFLEFGVFRLPPQWMMTWFLISTARLNWKNPNCSNFISYCNKKLILRTHFTNWVFWVKSQMLRMGWALKWKMVHCVPFFSDSLCLILNGLISWLLISSQGRI